MTLTEETGSAMPYGGSTKRAFGQQRSMARKRNIAFEFTFEEWVAWWETNLGPDWFKKRGKCYGQYVMARNRDIGAYTASNVRCVLCTVNHNERQHRLSDEMVCQIFLDNRTYAQIIKAYGVHPVKINEIRNGKKYEAITSGLIRKVKVVTITKDGKTSGYR